MRLGKWLCVGMVPALLCSCALLPQEEEYVSKPMIRSYVQAEYKLGYVQYGDVVLTEILSCKYMPVSTEQLKFNVGGIYYDEIFVEKGDLVQKGDLVAQLDVSGLDDEIESLQASVDAAERNIRNLREQMTLAVDSQRRILSAAGNADGLKTAEEVQKEYTDQIEKLEGDLEISNMRLSEAMDKLASRSLYAGIDGAVTFVRKLENGSRSNEGELVVSIADATSSVFSAETANADLLPAGAVVDILIKKEYVPATIVSAQELGLDEKINDAGRKTVYFRLNTPDADLESGDRGTLTITVRESKDTLYIPSKALQTVDSRTFVYQADENGLKRMKNVEIGLVTNHYIEILSGLSEGENVILD